MTSLRPSPTTVAQHLAGTAQSWHGKVSPDGPFKPEKGRYRLYIGLFCPFAHSANLVRHLKGLQEIIPVIVVKPYPKGDDKGWPGWQFPATDDEYPGANPDPLFHAKYLHELYFKADPEYRGRYSVPVLWDTQTNTIINNESAELLRDLQTGFNFILPDAHAKLTLYPEHLREKIDEISEWMQRDLNTGVYKAGFACTQEDYDKNVPVVFAALNELEKLIHANGGPYILGADLTELDIRAYATVVRFDTVYVQHFKCNLGTIRHDYPQINNWLKNLYWNVEGFRETTDFRHIKENYTKSHGDINPLAITPMGPWSDVEEGWERDVSKIAVWDVKMPRVLKLEGETVPFSAPFPIAHPQQQISHPSQVKDPPPPAQRPRHAKDVHEADPNPKLFVQMSGAPGAGKSTVAGLLAPSIGAVVIDHDVIRSSLLDSDVPFEEAAKHAYRLQWMLADALIRQGFSVVIDSTYNFPEVLERRPSYAREYSYAYWYIEYKV